MRSEKYPTIIPIIKYVFVYTNIVFHDCVSDQCDGCLNLDNPGNAGMSDIIDALDEIYLGKNYDSAMSRADFWSLTAISAIEMSRNRANDGPCNSGR